MVDAASGGSPFKTLKKLTRPTFKFVIGKAVYVRIDEKVFIGKELKKDASEGGNKREPAHVANVTNLETGELGQIIVSAVVLSVLNDEYPGDTYVGKCFSITKLQKTEGKAYFPYNVDEIEDPGASSHSSVGARKTASIKS